MGMIGSILTPTARYAEAHESGAIDDQIEAGVRTRIVTAVYHCLKAEARTVSAALPVRPDPLLTHGGRNPDGSAAPAVNWGSDFELVDVTASEISPSLCRLNARYQATDPTAGVNVDRSGALGGGIVGKPWEGGLRYAETQQSGRAREERVYLPASFGWNRTNNVDVDLICLKPDSRDIADSLSLAPAALTTNPHAGAAIAWGSGFSLVSLSGSPISPSFYRLNAKYRRSRAEAIVSPPSGVSLACAAGVCSIVWGGLTFETHDSGVPAGTDGFDVELDTENPYRIRLKCCGVVMEDYDPGVSTGDKVLAWDTDATTATLLWCGRAWKSFTVGD